MAAKTKVPVQEIPHSWPATEWPATIYPGSTARARYILRANRNDLVAAGALVRVGRDLVVLGGPYVAWIAKKGDRVDGFAIAANRARSRRRVNADQAAAA